MTQQVDRRHIQLVYAQVTIGLWLENLKNKPLGLVRGIAESASSVFCPGLRFRYQRGSFTLSFPGDRSYFLPPFSLRLQSHARHAIVKDPFGFGHSGCEVTTPRLLLYRRVDNGNWPGSCCFDHGFMDQVLKAWQNFQGSSGKNSWFGSGNEFSIHNDPQWLGWKVECPSKGGTLNHVEPIMPQSSLTSSLQLQVWGAEGCPSDTNTHQLQLCNHCLWWTLGAGHLLPKCNDDPWRLGRPCHLQISDEMHCGSKDGAQLCAGYCWMIAGLHHFTVIYQFANGLRNAPDVRQWTWHRFASRKDLLRPDLTSYAALMGSCGKAPRPKVSQRCPETVLKLVN